LTLRPYISTFHSLLCSLNKFSKCSFWHVRRLNTRWLVAGFKSTNIPSWIGCRIIIRQNQNFFALFSSVIWLDFSIDIFVCLLNLKIEVWCILINFTSPWIYLLTIFLGNNFFTCIWSLRMIVFDKKCWWFFLTLKSRLSLCKINTRTLCIF
jgi:hypothetical protein